LDPQSVDRCGRSVYRPPAAAKIKRSVGWPVLRKRSPEARAPKEGESPLRGARDPPFPTWVGTPPPLPKIKDLPTVCWVTVGGNGTRSKTNVFLDVALPAKMLSFFGRRRDSMRNPSGNGGGNKHEAKTPRNGMQPPDGVTGRVRSNGSGPCRVSVPPAGCHPQLSEVVGGARKTDRKTTLVCQPVPRFPRQNSPKVSGWAAGGPCGTHFAGRASTTRVG
jgi:hypothetical protein